MLSGRYHRTIHRIAPAIVLLGVPLSLLILAPRAAAEQTSRAIDVVAVIEPELSMTVQPDTGTRIDLGTIYSSTTDVRYSRPVGVQVHVSSNLGQPYEVTQEWLQPMVSADGAALPSGSLRVSDEHPSSGELLQGRSVDESPNLFVSGPDGRSQDWTATYQLQVPPGQQAGTYQGTLLMTVTAR